MRRRVGRVSAALTRRATRYGVIGPVVLRDAGYVTPDGFLGANARRARAKIYEMRAEDRRG